MLPYLFKLLPHLLVNPTFKNHLHVVSFCYELVPPIHFLPSRLLTYMDRFPNACFYCILLCTATAHTLYIPACPLMDNGKTQLLSRASRQTHAKRTDIQIHQPTTSFKHHLSSPAVFICLIAGAP